MKRFYIISETPVFSAQPVRPHTAAHWPDRLHCDVREDGGTCVAADVPVITGE